MMTRGLEQILLVHMREVFNSKLFDFVEMIHIPIRARPFF